MSKLLSCETVNSEDGTAIVVSFTGEAVTEQPRLHYDAKDLFSKSETINDRIRITDDSSEILDRYLLETAQSSILKDGRSPVVQLHLHNVGYVPSPFVDTLETMKMLLERRGGELKLVGVADELLEILKTTGAYERLGGDKNIIPTLCKTNYVKRVSGDDGPFSGVRDPNARSSRPGPSQSRIQK